jgi:hypothetical protein
MEIHRGKSLKILIEAEIEEIQIQLLKLIKKCNYTKNLER